MKIFVLLFCICVLNCNNILSQKPIKTIEAHNGDGFSMTFFGENNLITSGKDGFVNVWDVNNWTKTRKMEVEYPIVVQRSDYLILFDRSFVNNPSGIIYIKDKQFNNVGKIQYEEGKSFAYNHETICNGINIDKDNTVILLYENIKYIVRNGMPGDLSITGYIEKFNFEGKLLGTEQIYKTVLEDFDDKLLENKTYEGKSYRNSILTNDSKYLIGIPYLKERLDLTNRNDANTVMLNVIDVRNMKVVGEFISDNKIFKPLLASNSDGYLVAVANVSRDNWIYFIDLQTASVVKSFKGAKDWIKCMCISYDGKYLYAGDEGAIINVWDTENKKLVKRLKGHEDDIISVCVSPDNKILASLDEGGILKVWDTSTILD